MEKVAMQRTQMERITSYLNGEKIGQVTQSPTKMFEMAIEKTI